MAPVVGALLAVAFYRLIKYLEYETVVPGQDHDEKDVAATETTAEQKGDFDGVKEPTEAAGRPGQRLATANDTNAIV